MIILSTHNWCKKHKISPLLWTILNFCGYFTHFLRCFLAVKELLYETPYENNEDDTQYESFAKTETITVRDTAVINGNDIIMSLFAMTPYYYKTSETDKNKIKNLTSLETELEFDIRIFRKK